MQYFGDDNTNFSGNNFHRHIRSRLQIDHEVTMRYWKLCYRGIGHDSIVDLYCGFQPCDLVFECWSGVATEHMIQTDHLLLKTDFFRKSNSMTLNMKNSIEHGTNPTHLPIVYEPPLFWSLWVNKKPQLTTQIIMIDTCSTEMMKALQ